MVARRPRSDSADPPNGDETPIALRESEAEVRFLRAKLAELKEAGTFFLADATHAIKNSLTVTYSYLEILNSDFSEGLTEDQRSFLGIALENADKLRRLVDDLADLAALELGSAQIDLADADIREVVEAVRAEIQPSLDRAKIELTIENIDPICQATIDRDRLRDAVFRVLDNSIRFTPQGGAIDVRTRQDLDHLEIEIRDTGVGMPAERIDDALRPFVQLHRNPGETRESFGLGLPLCRSQIDAMGGTLSIESVEGDGTTVTIRLPITDSK
jgi:signal transduction histidine kinase